MFQFSTSEKEFVQVALASNVRIDGRSSNQRRTSVVKDSILDNLAGSSYLSLDHGRCEIYTGVKLKVANENQGEKSQKRVTLELSSMRKLTKEQSNTLVYMQQLLEEHFINKQAKRITQLSIPNSKWHHLQIHIESFILSEPHLSLIEPLYLSIQKALLSTAVPKLQCLFNEITNEETVELTNQDQMLNLTAIDALLLVGCFEGKYLLDLTPLQFQSVEAVILLTVKGQKVQSLQSLKGSIGGEQLHKVCKFALSNCK